MRFRSKSEKETKKKCTRKVSVRKERGKVLEYTDLQQTYSLEELMFYDDVLCDEM